MQLHRILPPTKTTQYRECSACLNAGRLEALQDLCHLRKAVLRPGRLQIWVMHCRSGTAAATAPCLILP